MRIAPFAFIRFAMLRQSFEEFNYFQAFHLFQHSNKKPPCVVQGGLIFMSVLEVNGIADAFTLFTFLGGFLIIIQ